MEGCMPARVLSGSFAGTSFSPRTAQAYTWTMRERPTLGRKAQRRLALKCRAELEELKLFSPSKINLFLRILRKRDDGYHDLASLFQVVDVGDDMQFRRLSNAGKDLMSCNMPQVPDDDSNLIVRPEILQSLEKTGEKLRLGVRTHKRVPLGGGMGGGSGNAATTLWAANEFCGRIASQEDLSAWAGEIGSDISVFFSQGTAYCTGRGEIVEEVDPPLPFDTPILLVKPPTGCSTPLVFSALKLQNCSTADPKDLLSRFSADLPVLPEICINDLEEPAFDWYPELLELKRRLLQESDDRFSAVFMTDSPPKFLSESIYRETFVRPARLLRRSPDQWYQPALIPSR